MLRLLIVCVSLLVGCSARVDHYAADKPCGNPRYQSLMRTADRTPEQQAEFDSLNKRCDQYFDSLSRTEDLRGGKLDATGVLLLAAVGGLIYLFHFLSKIRFG